MPQAWKNSLKTEDQEVRRFEGEDDAVKKALCAAVMLGQVVATDGLYYLRIVGTHPLVKSDVVVVGPAEGTKLPKEQKWPHADEG